VIERHLWHPVAAERDVPQGAPLAVRLLGEEIVLWRDATGAARAFDDRCPHRGTKLSIGRVCASGELECAYHGWRFGGDGRCVAVPALPEFTPPISHAAKRHALQAAYGMLWLRLAEDGEAGPPPFDAEADAGLRKLLVGPCDVATSAPRIVENFLDLSHFAFVHEGSLGERGHARAEHCEVSADAERGLTITGARAWQPQAHAAAGEGGFIDYGWRVASPYNAVLTKQQGGYREAIALFCCPLDAETTRVWFRLAVAGHDAGDEALRDFQLRVFEQDRAILEAQRPRRLPLAGGEVHSGADRTSAAYRRWLQQRGIGYGTC
jgi:phenylpropionate dioxygenase-like ring-hydroxylating dioxygenase large terminal subunit